MYFSQLETPSTLTQAMYFSQLEIPSTLTRNATPLISLIPIYAIGPSLTKTTPKTLNFDPSGVFPNHLSNLVFIPIKSTVDHIWCYLLRSGWQHKFMVLLLGRLGQDWRQPARISIDSAARTESPRVRY